MSDISADKKEAGIREAEWQERLDHNNLRDVVYEKNPSTSIIDAYNKPPIMEFEGFILRPFDGWHLWFENPEGEGMMIRKAKFLGWLIRFFEKEF